jgi:hypothetical protein
MALVPVFHSEVVDAYYDDENAWLYLDWQGVQDLEQVQDACRQLYAYLKISGCQKVLNDNTHVTQTSWELVEWISHDYFPLVARSKVAYIAWVHSPILNCRSDLDLLACFINNKPQVAVFDDVAEAHDWLGRMEQVRHTHRVAARLTYFE